MLELYHGRGTFEAVLANKDIEEDGWLAGVRIQTVGRNYGKWYWNLRLSFGKRMQGDRGADLFDFFHASQATQTHFLVRAAQNRRTQSDEQEVGYLLDQARAWPSQQSRPFEVPASHGRQAIAIGE
ncbi:MAG TPA: hypothetical protein VFV38_16810 [Ktedonobacteraceae bacterium]|nr:hypothetical protein [Ktedonobacteraceae bacterium]